jgi:hypothetical protein
MMVEEYDRVVEQLSHQIVPIEEELKLTKEELVWSKHTRKILLRACSFRLMNYFCRAVNAIVAAAATAQRNRRHIFQSSPMLSGDDISWQ